MTTKYKLYAKATSFKTKSKDQHIKDLQVSIHDLRDQLSYTGEKLTEYSQRTYILEQQLKSKDEVVAMANRALDTIRNLTTFK